MHSTRPTLAQPRTRGLATAGLVLGRSRSADCMRARVCVAYITGTAGLDRSGTGDAQPGNGNPC